MCDEAAYPAHRGISPIPGGVTAACHLQGQRTITSVAPLRPEHEIGQAGKRDPKHIGLLAVAPRSRASRRPPATAIHTPPTLVRASKRQLPPCKTEQDSARFQVKRSRKPDTDRCEVRTDRCVSRSPADLKQRGTGSSSGAIARLGIAPCRRPHFFTVAGAASTALHLPFARFWDACHTPGTSCAPYAH